MEIRCPQCDFENEEGSKFCKNCNLPLSKQDYDEDNPYTQKNTKEEKIRAETRVFQAEKTKIEKEKKTSPLGAGYKGRQKMKALKINNIIKLILIVLVILFAVYVWPTPYKYLPHYGGKVPFRMHRITGKGEVW